MAGGPIFPNSIYHTDVTGRTFQNFYVGGGVNAAPNDEGIGVKASLDANATVQFRFTMPPTVPSGTLKLRALHLANAITGIVLYAVTDKNVAAGASPSAATLSSETFSAINVLAVTGGTTNTTVTTVSAHNLSVGSVVTIASVGGATQANGTFTVTSVGSSVAFNITTSTTSAYTSGGTVTQQVGAGWITGQPDKYQEMKLPLSISPSGNDVIVMAVQFLTASWTLATPVTVIFSVLWE